MSRAKNLSDEDVAKIVEVLDGWTGKLSWELLINAIEKRMFARYTRQALHKHARIKDAFAHSKAKLAGEGGRPRKTASSPEHQLALDRIERLTNENARLEAENTRLLEQFVRWAYNAHLRKLDETFLNQPLPAVDRQQTRVSRVGRAAASVSKKD
jgi:hypothetical protein